MISKTVGTFKDRGTEKNSEKSKGTITEPYPTRQNPFGLTVSIWVFIGTVIATLAGVSVGVVPYLLFPSLLTESLALLFGILAIATIPMYIAAKQDQRRKKARIQEEEKAFFESMGEISSLLEEGRHRGKPT